MYTNTMATTTNSDNHFWLFTAPNGKLFHAGPAKTTHYLSLEGQGSVVEKAARGSGDTMNGNALMYDIAKILTLGGSADYDNSLGTDEAHIITLDGTGTTDDVTIEPVPNGMVYPRVMSNSVILPNGQVVVVGGMVRALTFSLEGAIFAAELFDPVTRTFTEMASMSEARNYHATAILLQDGRVWAGGGGHCLVEDCNSIAKSTRPHTLSTQARIG
jgi:galactose oxidase